MSTNELNSKIYYKLLLFIGVFIGVLFFGRVDVSAGTYDKYGFEVTDSGSKWEKVSGVTGTIINEDTAWEYVDVKSSVTGKVVATDLYGEIITEEKTTTNPDYYIVTFRYYLYHKGVSYQEQQHPLKLVINNYDTGYEFNTGTNGFYGTSSGKYYYGGYIKVKFKRGSAYTLTLNSTGEGTATTAMHSSVRNYPYPKYTVNFYNGSTLLKSQTVYRYGSATAPSNPSKTGYTFTGWDKSYTNITANTDVYAQWTPTKYTINYVLNGGTNNSSNPSSYTIETSTITLKDPTRTGYEFEGWYSDANFTNKVTQITKGSTGNKTLYAKWKAKKYTISYVLNGGTNNSANPSTYTIEDTVTFKDPTKTHYTFGGWYKESSFKNKTTGISKGSTGNVTVYAKWTNSLPVINTVVNGGVNNSDSNVASNIPPYVSGDSLIIQVGDPFDPNDFFDYSDAETPKKDLTVTVNNPVPTDSKGNTTTAGNYTVTITVTDGAGGKSSATINVIVNDPPTLTAKDRWFYTGEVVDKAEILAKVSAVDYEDGDIKGVFNKKKV